MDKNSVFTQLTPQDVNRIIEMAWEDRTPFEAIKIQFGLAQKDVIILMRRNLKTGRWKKWREHTQNRPTKHLKLRTFKVGTHKCDLQRAITGNRISKKKY